MTPGRWIVPLLPCLAGCIDYRVVTPPATPIPALSASPNSVALGKVCGGEPETVTLTNAGTGRATISDIRVDGMGWTVGALPALPFVLQTLTDDPDAHLDIPLNAAAGVATLRVLSDAAEVDVPLRASDNVHPTAYILSPYDSQVIGEGDDLSLTGVISDGDDDLSTLSVEWRGEYGFVASGVADADGRVETDWPPADRGSGPQLVEIVVADPCGDEGEATQYFCQDGPFAVDVLNDEAWRFDGGAGWDGSELTLVDGPDATGAGFDLFSLFDGDVLHVQFEFLIGEEGGAGAVPEGFSFTVLDPSRLTTYIGGDRCGLGYGGGADCTSGPALPGWSVEFDTVPGEDDCAVGDHVAVVVDGVITAPAGCATIPLLGVWRTGEITVEPGQISLTVDGATVLNAPIASGQDFEGFAGFTAATNDEGGSVRLRNVTVIDSTCVR